MIKIIGKMQRKDFILINTITPSDILLYFLCHFI